MDVQMDRGDEWYSRWMDGWRNVLEDKKMGGGGETDGWVKEWMGVQMNKETGGWMNGEWEGDRQFVVGGSVGGVDGIEITE